MNRIVMVIPDRNVGWDGTRLLPLISPEECAGHAGLSAAGFLVDLMAEKSFVEGGARSDDLVMLTKPSERLREVVEKRMRQSGGRLLVANDRVHSQTSRHLWQTRRLVGLPSAKTSTVRLSARHARPGRREMLRGLGPFSVLEVEGGEEVVASWGNNGPPAILGKTVRGFRRWRTGFGLDHLDSHDLVELVSALTGDNRGPRTLVPPVPSRARAVVLLLHDVEEPIVGDSGGIRSVRKGIEACLSAEARHGFRATYNLVGRFGGQIPDLVRRINAEGHELGSHGETHRVVADLAGEALRREISGAEECIVRYAGAIIRGFRSPRSRWSGELLDCLAERGYRWNAEVDPSPFPYRIPRGTPRPFVRVPVAVDDWDYVKKGSTPAQVSKTWMQAVRWGVKKGCWVVVGSHPSVLGVEPGRMSAFSDFLGWLAAEGVWVCTHGEATDWWLTRMVGGEDEVEGAAPRMTMRQE